MGAVCKRSATKLDPSYAYHKDESFPYLILDACSDNSSDTELNDTCKGINKTELEDYIWVSDKATGHIYQNFHCATCHGVKAWVSWRIRTTCRDVKMADFDRVTEILLSPTCDIINEVPEEFQETIRKHRCYIPDKYSRCNMTGLWGEYDAVTYAACETFNLPFYQDSPRGGLAAIYKNIFCYVCNENILWNWLQTTCSIWEEDSIRDIGTTFSALINYETASDTQKDTTCVMSEVFDSYMVSFNRSSPDGPIRVAKLIAYRSLQRAQRS